MSDIATRAKLRKESVVESATAPASAVRRS
jgi:hypothetical protein